MLIELTRIQGEERTTFWVNSDHILMLTRVPVASPEAKSVLQLVGYASNVFVAETPEEVLARIKAAQ